MEMAREFLTGAIEATHGTPEASPTFMLELDGLITGKEAVATMTEAAGDRVSYHRQKLIRRWTSWAANGALNPSLAHKLFQGIVPVAAPSTPGGATLSRLWEFVPSTSTDSIETFTLWWGDPTVAVYRAGYGLLQNVTLTADAGGTTVPAVNLSGVAHYFERVSAPTLPARTGAGGMSPLHFQAWLDTGAIGGTELTGRIASMKVALSLGVEPEWTAISDPTAAPNFNRHGFTRGLQATTEITLTIPDTTELAVWEGVNRVALRTRVNGDLIEAGFHHYVEVDNYGLLRFRDWGVLSSGGRTVSLTVMSDYETSIGAPFVARVQNAEATL